MFSFSCAFFQQKAFHAFSLLWCFREICGAMCKSDRTHWTLLAWVPATSWICFWTVAYASVSDCRYFVDASCHLSLRTDRASLLNGMRERVVGALLDDAGTSVWKKWCCGICQLHHCALVPI